MRRSPFGGWSKRVSERRRRARSLTPGLELCEGRCLLSASGLEPLAARSALVARASNPLAPYSWLVVRIERGPHAGLTMAGPVVLGFDGRIQVIGFFFPLGGRRETVVGTAVGRAVDLRIVLNGPVALELAGPGQLVRVRGGLPDGLALVGSGHASGPARADVGAWVTLRPPMPAIP